jgi:ADP-dependent NAD(P)H-hydrate dehydratase / NAD(P)H-hydrate epimerase
MEQLTPSSHWPIYLKDALRILERELQARSKTPLMVQAGKATARLALALAPHARKIWVAAGPGNNGGDGLEAAMHLHQAGKEVVVSLLLDPDKHPSDAKAALARALQAGVTVQTQIPSAWLSSMTAQDLCIDALLGTGGTKTLNTAMQSLVKAMNASPAQVLAIDIPTGLDADSGQIHPANAAVHAAHTLTFLAGKPGLFMNHGRDVCGQLWLERLEGALPIPNSFRRPTPQAWTNVVAERPLKLHASHKGSHGDVVIVGGAQGMGGAAVLAATSALQAGAGRVMVSCLGVPASALPPDVMQPDEDTLELEHLSVVAGCGGSHTFAARLPDLLQRSAQLTLDADGLNALATDEHLQNLLRLRGPDKPTVLTPHPLEAARLLGISTAEVQNQRLSSAQKLADQYSCVVVLKGSGTVIAAPDRLPVINMTGNGRLATGGTGDVLAGLVGARMAQGMSAWDAACSAVQQHGEIADQWPAETALTASRLAQKIQ